MTEIQKEILSARPSLRKILPVVFWCTFVFSLLNFGIALGLFYWEPTAYPIVAPNQLFVYIWAGLYALIGLILAWGLAMKRWELLRGLMCVALFFKLFWSISLLDRVNDGGTYFLIAALFIGLAALQAVIIIFYLPPDEAVDGSAP